MTTPGPVCPYLGLADDPATHLAFPSHAQRCHATSRPSTVDAAKQARDCLTEAHTSCARYRPFAAPVPHGAVRAAIAATTLEPGRPASRVGVRSASRVVRLSLLVVTLAFAGIMLGAWLASTMSTPPAASGSPGQGSPGVPVAGVGSLTPTPTPTSTPTITRTPAPTPTASPTTSPTPTPTPAPTPAVHRIKRGETLTSIAEQYGVTIRALRKANGIVDPNLIIVGQVLVIPTR